MTSFGALRDVVIPAETCFGGDIERLLLTSFLESIYLDCLKFLTFYLSKGYIFFEVGL